MKIKVVSLCVMLCTVQQSYVKQNWRSSLSSMLSSVQKIGEGYLPYCCFTPGLSAVAIGAWLNRDPRAHALIDSLRWGGLSLLMGAYYYVKQQQNKQGEVKHDESAKSGKKEKIAGVNNEEELSCNILIEEYKTNAHALMDRLNESDINNQTDLLQKYTQLEASYDQITGTYNIRGLIDPRTYVLAGIFGRMIMRREPKLVKKYNIESINDLKPLDGWVRIFVNKKNNEAFQERNAIIKQAGLADKMYASQGIYAEIYTDQRIYDLVKEIAVMLSRKARQSVSK